MSIKFRLTVMSFLQFFVWGAWLITIGNYWFGTKQWSGAEFGAIFSTLGISSIFMPALTGIIADKFINAEKLYGVLHILGGIALLFLPQVNNSVTFYWIIFAAMLCYMPTIALSNSVAYTILKNNEYDVIKVFPPIRVWGTIGFIVAMWTTNLSGNKAAANMFYIAACSAVILGIYSFTLPKCPPQKLIADNASFAEKFGLKAFKLFGTYKMALFFIFSMFLGGALQLTNMYGDSYISEFNKMTYYADLFAKYETVFLPKFHALGSFWDKIDYIFHYPNLIPSLVIRYSTIIMSISQISETVFILAIPFFLRRFGIKKVMLISMLAWVFRFGLFAYGNPSDGLWMIVLSCIVYGMAFDFFNISGSLFVETTTDASIRSSAQGLFMMMSNGFGAFFGGLVSGIVIDKFFTHAGNRDWHSIWLSFSGYALVIAVLFAILFKHKHDPKALEKVHH